MRRGFISGYLNTAILHDFAQICNLFRNTLSAPHIISPRAYAIPGGCVMNACELVAAISALACSIAQEYPDNTELDVLGSIFVQLGETLETIALQRELEEKRLHFGKGDF